MNWSPPQTLEEKIKDKLVPADVYIRYLTRKMAKKGEPEINLLPILAHKGRVSLDIGANKGAYSYALLSCSQAVHAFEPNPKAFQTLSKWGADQQNLTLHNIALGNKNGQATLRVPKTDTGYSNQMGSLNPVAVDGDHGQVTVDTKRLDDLNIENVGFIKIDVEGFELQTLEGAANTIKRDRPNMVIELEERHTNQPLPDLVGAVCDYGYQALVLIDGVLTPFSRYDVGRYHANPSDKVNYINNFVFLAQ